VKTDKLFYNLVKQLPEIFFQLIGKPDTDPNIYTFIAQAVKEQSFNLDGLLSTITGHDTEPLYFVEAQGYKDEKFYERFFGQIFVYFGQYSPSNTKWYAIVIYDRKSRETPPHPRYQTLVDNHLHRIYLNELPDDGSLATGIAKLFVESPKKTATLAQRLIAQAKEEISDETNQNKVLEFIQSVVVNKFPNVSPEGIKAMLDLTDDIENTAYYKSIMKETKFKVIPTLLRKGCSVEEIAKDLELDVEEVRKVVNQDK
jgi:predicted transposase/invertase (TIGR01784 family)